MNDCCADPVTFARLKVLTVADYSGLSYELKQMEGPLKGTKVNAPVVLAIDEDDNNKILGWGLMWGETSKYCPDWEKFVPGTGFIFQSFVEEASRRNGIGGQIKEEIQKMKTVGPDGKEEDLLKPEMKIFFGICDDVSYKYFMPHFDKGLFEDLTDGITRDD